LDDKSSDDGDKRQVGNKGKLGARLKFNIIIKERLCLLLQLLPIARALIGAQKV